MATRSWFLIFCVCLLVLASNVEQRSSAASLVKQRPGHTNEIGPVKQFTVQRTIEKRFVQDVITAQSSPALTSLSETFEGLWPTPGWEVSDQSDLDNGEYFWGKRNCHPHTGSFGGWSIGAGAQGNALGCSANYPNNVRSWVVYGPFDLTNKPSASLVFHFWGRTEVQLGCPTDFFFVGTSLNATDFAGTRYCGDFTDGSAGNGYYEETLDLNDQLGQQQVWVGFLLKSDGSVTNSGITIDDISLNIASPLASACESLRPAVYVPLTSGGGPESLRPFGSNLLGVKNYWPYFATAAGDQQLMINVANGNLILSAVDQSIPTPGIDSVLARSYNTLSPYSGEFGSGWTSSVGNSVRLTFQLDGAVSFFDSSGKIDTFTRQADGFVAPQGSHYTLEDHSNGTYTLTRISGGTKFTFDSLGRLTNIMDRNGNTQSYRRDTTGNVVEINDSVGGSTVIAYSSAKLVTNIRDRAGRASQYHYGRDSRLIEYINPAGHTTRYRYGACGKLVEVIDVNNSHWAFDYDVQGRIARISDPLGATTQFTYQEGATLVTDANNHTTSYRYDESGKLQAYADANAHIRRYAWDEFANLISITSPLNETTQYAWNGNTGLLASVSDSLGNRVTYTYDSDNNLSSITDARGNATRFAYDTGGANLLNLTQADDGQLTFTYDSRGNLLTLTDPNGNARDTSNPNGLPYRYIYNSYAYPTDSYDPLGNHWMATWDNTTGNLVSVRDAKGQVAHYEYDVLDRLTSIIYADSTKVSFTYDPLGNLTSMEDQWGRTFYTYDRVGQLRTEDSSRTTGSIQYSYDSVGNLTSLQRENGVVLTFTYDAADHLISQSNPFDGGKQITYGYDQDYRLVDIVYPNNDHTTYSYYPNSWLQSLLTTSSNGTIYDKYEYPSPLAGGYDRNGNPLQITRTVASFDNQGGLSSISEKWNMRYDSMDRMVEQNTYSSGGTWQWQVTVDHTPNGLWSNRTYRDATQSQAWQYHYDAASRWTGISYWDGRRDTVINDANGNQTQLREEFFAAAASVKDRFPSSASLNNELLSRPLNSTPGRSTSNRQVAGAITTNITDFTYDAADRMTRVTDPSGTNFTFAYDGFDRMIEENSSEFTTPKQQYYDLLGIASETQGSAAVDYLHDLAGNVRAHAGRGMASSYFHRDPRGQISHISGIALQISIDYCPWGNVQAAGVSASGAPYQPLLSTDRYAIGLEGTQQASILLHQGGGDFWPHNAQVSIHNIPAIPSMQNVMPHADSDTDDDQDNRDNRLILFHYGTADKISFIKATQTIPVSLEQDNPKRARYGDGVYFTELAPGSMDKARLARVLYGNPWPATQKSVEAWVAVDVTGLTIIGERTHVYRVPTTTDLPVAGRIVGTGSTP